ncbi:hypothetical protein C8Q79DRAFT_1002951 [Trametes meyenii]|nr:hypothetical protein C8Q79DRAFT_1002951 [Trametes meyenii]
MPLTEAERRQFRLEPTPEVVKAAWDTIRQHESAIGSIEARIQVLLDHVRDLRYDQAKHRASIERCIGLITLARRLPAELLIKIFMHCVEDGWTRAPLVVSHVCAAWRKAALAPQVWSHVYVRCDDAAVLERTRFWLARAGGAYLHVTVVASWRVHSDGITGPMELLAERKAQWRSLSVETDMWRHADIILMECRGAMPELRELDVRTAALDIVQGDGVFDPIYLSRSFEVESAPRLTALSYVSNVIPVTPIFPSHITDLTLEVKETTRRPLSTAAIVNVLERLPELRTLSFSMPLVYEHEFIPEQGSDRAASLPALDSLTLYGPTDLNELLPHLHTPSLRHLHLRSLEDLGYRQHPIGPSLVRFVHASAPPLKLLELHDIDLDPETFATCFDALPELRELRLHESSISDATVQLLSGPRGLCPRLRRIDVRWCGHLRGRALVDLVRSRRSVDDLPGSVSDPIEEVGVINCCFVTEDDVLDLARMTVCRVVTRENDDYCRTTGCCVNQRYRTRLRLRHVSEFIDQKGKLKLVL